MMEDDDKTLRTIHDFIGPLTFMSQKQKNVNIFFFPGINSSFIYPCNFFPDKYLYNLKKIVN